MADYSEQLHLDFDPFDLASETGHFFPGGQRQELLDQLLELCVCSSDLIAVTGPLGSGKSTLACWLALSLDAEFVAVQIRASLFMSGEQFLETLALELGLELASDASTDELLERVGQYVDTLHARSRCLQLLVDDAHELGEEALRCVLALLERQADSSSLGEDGIKAVLFGEATLRGSVEKLAPSAHQLLELKALDLVETTRYVEFKLDCAGFDGDLPIDQDALAVIHSRARGMPGTINVLIRDELTDSWTPRQTLPRLGFIERHLVPFSVVFGALVLLLFFTVGGEDQSGSGQMAAVAAAEGGSQGQPTGQVRVEIPLQITSASAAISNRGGGAAATTDGRVSGSIAGTGRGDRPTDTLSSSQRRSASEAGEGTAPAERKQDAATPARVVQSAPSDTGPAGGPPANTVGQQSLLAQPADSYTLQLLGSHSESNVKNFIASQPDPAAMRYFASRYQDKPWFVVVYGNFPTQDAARDAIDRLPSGLQELKPWARNLADIQADIRRNQ
ncbi:MAG: AAA family ATPase [Gammaproteobacteria bacterium]